MKVKNVKDFFMLVMDILKLKCQDEDEALAAAKKYQEWCQKKSER